MQIEVASSPSEKDEAYVVAKIREYNSTFMPVDGKPLCIFARDPDGNIIGGKTYWNYLKVSFLWVQQDKRRAGHATALMSAAEKKARQRSCTNVLLDTFSFQARGFYMKPGYSEFGQIAGFLDNHERYYLRKRPGVG